MPVNAQGQARTNLDLEFPNNEFNRLLATLVLLNHSMRSRQPVWLPPREPAAAVNQQVENVRLQGGQVRPIYPPWYFLFQSTF